MNRRNLRFLFAKTKVYFVLILVAIFAVLWGVSLLSFNALLERRGLYRLDNDLVFTLPLNIEQKRIYHRYSKPKDALKNLSRTFTVKTDDRGRRVVEGNSQNGIRFLMVGDSCLYGTDLNQGETIADQLVQMGKTSNLPIGASNYCIPGTNSRVALLEATYLVPQEQPDVLIISVCFNDAQSAPDFVIHLFNRAIDHLVVKKRNKYRILSGFLLRLSIPAMVSLIHEPDRRSMVLPDQYRKNIERIAALADREKALCIFLGTRTEWTGSSLNDSDDPYNGALRDVAAREDHVRMVHIMDLAKEATPYVLASDGWVEQRERIRRTYKEERLGEESTYWTTTDGGHPNPILAKIIAWEIFQDLYQMRPETFPKPPPNWRTW